MTMGTLIKILSRSIISADSLTREAIWQKKQKLKWLPKKWLQLMTEAISDLCHVGCVVLGWGMKIKNAHHAVLYLWVWILQIHIHLAVVTSKIRYVMQCDNLALF